MQSVSPAVMPEPVITSQNVVPLAKVVVGGLCVMSLLGVTAYSINKTGSAEALSGMAPVFTAVFTAFIGPPAVLG
jgi:hypothetical protein